MDFIDFPGEDAGRFPFSAGVHHGDLLFLSGQLATDDPTFAGPIGDIEVETRTVMERLGRVLAASGAGFADVIRVGIFMTDLGAFERMNGVYRSYFPGPRLPARTCVGVTSLLRGASIEIDCVARIITTTVHCAKVS